MGSRSPVGTTSTKFDLVLDQYFPQRSGNWLYQILENRTDALLLALLYEMQTMNHGDGFELEQEKRPDQQEADYFVTEGPVAVTSTSESDHRLNWGFPATAVTIWGFEEPLYASFRSSGDNRKIPLEPEDSPFSLSPEGGLGASEVRLRKLTSDQEDPAVKVIAFR